MVILVELEREVQLHRAVIAAQGVKDSLDKLRTHLTELRAASRLGALTGDSGAFVDIERRAQVGGIHRGDSLLPKSVA